VPNLGGPAQRAVLVGEPRLASGFSMKSNAPAFVASTAVLTVP
jgi:hypothetical protein